MIKLIAMDLDGTLMAPDHITVTEKTKSALEKAHDMGIKTVIATGRTLSVINDVLKQVPFIDYVIYSNGAGVYDRCKGENIYTNCMPAEVTEKVVDILESYPVYYELYANGVSNADENKIDFFKNKDLPAEFLDFYIKNLEKHKNISKFAKHNEIEKINLFYFDGEFYDEIREKLYAFDEIDKTSPVSGDIEMTYKGVNKGVALENMCKELCFTSDEVMSFGDADNDIEMLQFAGYG
ncbi:MAG: HAD-IIB family hydrolase, partial [Eubacterium sp.]|nr:HAD-IIB family hydrolase [Eubacterium sp.]